MASTATVSSTGLAASATCTTSAATGGTASSTVVDEETADEVKVFRSSAQDDDPSELAGSSAELNADKQELAMEADIESQADISQQHRFNPIVNPLGPLPWPSPGSNMMLNCLMAATLSPVYAAAAQQRFAQQLYATASILARHSPNYMGLAGNAAAPFGQAAFERPPAFSLSQPCTPQQPRNGGQQSSSAANGNNLMNPLGQLNSPMSSLGGVLGGMALSSAERAAAIHQQHNHNQQQQQAQRHHGIATAQQMRTPKREKAERREKGGHHNQQGGDKKEHIKKPMNAFMLFMKENRHKYMDECAERRKQSAELNKELGQIWQQMSRDEQQPYYDMSAKKREEHQRLYPNWTARENYAIHKRTKRRKTRDKSPDGNEQKKCRARFGVDNLHQWCKHCRRKKRCLNVRDSDSPVQVSSTTNPTTPLSLGLPGSSHQQQQFGTMGALFGAPLPGDSPHSSLSGGGPLKTECGQSTSELSRCSSAASSCSEASGGTAAQSGGEEEQHQPTQRQRVVDIKNSSPMGQQQQNGGGAQM